MLGTQHQDTIASRVYLAAAYLNTGHIIKAAGMLEESILQLTAVEGPLQLDALHWLQFVALMSASAGQLDGADTLLDKVVQGRQKTQGQEHPDTLKAMILLANIRVQRAEYSAAEPLLLQA